MQGVLGVSNSRQMLSLEIGSPSYWCVFSGYDAKPGDHIAMYFTKYGIAQFYRIDRIVESVETENEVPCLVRWMLTARTTLLITLPNPISAGQIRSDKVLGSLGALRRNFQATSFKVAPEHWKRILDLASKQNPKVSFVATESV